MKKLIDRLCTKCGPGGRTVVALLLAAVMGCGSAPTEEGEAAAAKAEVPPEKPAPAEPAAAPPANPPAKAPRKVPRFPVEAFDPTGITTVKEYEYRPATRLPAIDEAAVSGYRWDNETKTVRFPINVWIGWLPVIAANRGAKASEESVFFKKHGFKVELVLVDDPVACRDGFVAGEFPILWGTVDMMVLFSEGLMKDSRTAPRIFQQVDWSNGGDGIVVRDNIKSVADLKGKKVVYAQNSPSQYYLNALLIHAGIRPADVDHRYTATAFEAAAAFVSDESIDACVSWAPDIYNIIKRVKGTRLLSTTADANRLIAGVWAARADFAKDHPEIIEGLVSGIFDGMNFLKRSPEESCRWTAELFAMEVDDVRKMYTDARNTGFAENCSFFLDQNNATNFERTWGSASYVYRKLGVVDSPAKFDQVMDFTILKELRAKGVFKETSVEPDVVPAPADLAAQGEEILSNAIRVNFFPNSDNLREPARDEFGNMVKDRLYDPTVDDALERLGQLIGQFGNTRVRIVGHTDSSMKGKVDASAVKDLSGRRAEAVMNALIEKYKFPKERFEASGAGWDEPANPEQPMNHALNRRVVVTLVREGAK